MFSVLYLDVKPSFQLTGHIASKISQSNTFITCIKNKLLLIFADMSEVKHSIQKAAPMPVSNGFGKHDQMSSGLRAAAVHGQLISQENDPLVRKPTRLETLQPIGGGRKGKKKRNELQPL